MSKCGFHYCLGLIFPLSSKVARLCSLAKQPRLDKYIHKDIIYRSPSAFILLLIHFDMIEIPLPFIVWNCILLTIHNFQCHTDFWHFSSIERWWFRISFMSFLALEFHSLLIFPLIYIIFCFSHIDIISQSMTSFRRLRYRHMYLWALDFATSPWNSPPR